MRIPGLRLEEGAEALSWRETKVDGVSWIPLHLEESGSDGTRTRGGGTVLIRMAPGCGYPTHSHVGVEDVLVLAGGYTDEHGTYRQGDHVHYPAASVHSPCALGDATRATDDSNPACVLYTNAPEGIELLPESVEATTTP